MILHVINARYVNDYKVEVWFNDGNSGIVDLGDNVFFKGPVFGPLKDLNYFMDFIIDPELNTLVWKNGADLAPEYIASKILVNHI